MTFDDYAMSKGYERIHGSTYVNEKTGKVFGYSGLSLVSHQPGAYAETIPCVNVGLFGYIGFDKAFDALAVNDHFNI